MVSFLPWVACRLCLGTQVTYDECGLPYRTPADSLKRLQFGKLGEASELHVDESGINLGSPSTLLELAYCFADIEKSAILSHTAVAHSVQAMIRRFKENIEVLRSGTTFVDKCLSLIATRLGQFEYEIKYTDCLSRALVHTDSAAARRSARHGGCKAFGAREAVR